MNKSVLLILFGCITLVACDNNAHKKDRNADTIATTPVSLPSGPADLADNDSLELLQLTKKLYRWVEEESGGSDFDPYLAQPNDTIYAGIDLEIHQKRMKELEQTGLFTQSFIANYNKIALAIDKELKGQDLVWNVGVLPPFGNGANPWCNCQDRPDNYLDKIWIMNLSLKNDTASYNWSWGNGLVYHIKALKKEGAWRVTYMEGFDYDAYIQSFVYENNIEGSWENGMVRIDITDQMLTLWYHGQCVYFYPARKTGKQSIEMIWDRDMDCKFDNGTKETFNLKKVPVKGRPFAKFTLRNNTLYADYYYKEWVQQYTKQVQDEVFTPTYSRRRDGY